MSIRDIPKNDEEWTLTISGTPESIQKAKELIEETLNQAEAEYKKQKAEKKQKAAKKTAHEKKQKAAKKTAHEKMLAEHKAAKKAKKGSPTEKKTG